MNFLKPKFWDKNQITFLSIILLPFATVLKLLSFFKKIITKKYKFTVPIICVGNIYVGGTGKTPLSIEIFSILKNLKLKPAFVRKKYIAFQDEVDLLKKIGPVYQSKKRANAINEAVKDKADVVILDDGYQDFSIKTNLNIICFNEKQWIGNGLVIPSGPLRESLSSLKRADCVIINGKKNETIEKKILKVKNTIKIFYSRYIPENINIFKNKKVISFAGIGNPKNFFNLLKENNIQLLDTISFPDHYNYKEHDLNNLIKKANDNDAILLTTEKDYLRINKNYKKNLNFLKIQVIIEEKNDFVNYLKKIYENN